MSFKSLLIILTVVFSSRISFAQELSNSDSIRYWQGIPGIEQTNRGRLFFSWFSGGSKEPSPDNTVYLCYSDDQGKTFSELVAMAGSKDGARAFDPTLWMDPDNKLWYIFNRGNKEAAHHAVYARICKHPDRNKLVWSNEFKLDIPSPYVFRMNKLTVLSTGEWVLPVTHALEPVFDWFADEKQLQGVAISTNQGKIWALNGTIEAPKWALECMTVELKDKQLWMLIRTGSGYLWESFSANKGKTWTEAKPTEIESPGSRFFISRLNSGNLILVNHYNFKGRSHLTAQISTDDGKTWNDGLLLDERRNISYPDGVQSKNGLIWIVYDRDRQGAGEILMAKFREEDVIAGKNVSGEMYLKQVVNKLK